MSTNTISSTAAESNPLRNRGGLMTCSTCKAEPFAVDPGTGRTVCEDCFEASEIGLPPLEVGPLLEERKLCESPPTRTTPALGRQGG